MALRLKEQYIGKVRLGELNTSKNCIATDNGEGCTEEPLVVPIESARTFARRGDPGISLLKLKEDVHMTASITPICLPSSNPGPKNFTTASWTNSAEVWKQQQQPVHLVDNAACQEAHTKVGSGVRLCDRQLCAAGQGFKPCRAARGSPLMDHVDGKRVLVGVKSYYSGDKSEVPDVYTKVRPYLDEIKREIESCA